MSDVFLVFDFDRVWNSNWSPSSIKYALDFSRTSYRKAQKKKKRRKHTRCGKCGWYMDAEVTANALTGRYEVWKHCDAVCGNIISLA